MTRPRAKVQVQTSLERWASERLKRILKHRKDTKRYGAEWPNQSLLLREIVQGYLQEHPEMDPHAEARSRLIVALDMEPRLVLEAASKLKGHVGAYKVNSAFTSQGSEMVSHLFRNAGPVFLDLKFNDIPNTVANHVIAVTEMGKGYKVGAPADPEVSMMTMHIAAGPAAMKAAIEAARTTAVNLRRPAPKILGITVLTSLSAEDCEAVGMDIHGETDAAAIQDIVLKRAKLAAECGLDGLVCSGKEVAAVRAVVGDQMKLIVPGIRPPVEGGSEDDQTRVVTPEKAIKAGADFLVVGRPIYGALDPAQAADEIVAQIAEALNG